MKSGKIKAVVLLLLICISMPLLTISTTQAATNIPNSELENRIDNYVSQYIGQSTPGTTVVIVKDGEIIFSKGYGYANIENSITIDPTTTIFEWGSSSKPFVWVSVMQLVERGLINLDVDINTYLPEVLRQQLAFQMPFTMRDLLNHTAGFAEQALGSFVTNEVAQNLSLEDALLLMQPKQIYTPGTVSAYSNFGTALAAYIVGNISSQGYTAFEMENIFIPAGMNNTLNQPDWINNHNFLQAKATGYMPDGRGGFREGVRSYIALYPAGAINGTAEDLARFIIALTPPQGESGILFENPHSLTTLFTPSSLDPINFPGTHHGFMSKKGSTTFGHAGGTSSFTTNLAIVPSERFGIVVISNAPGELDIAYGLINYLLADDTPQIQPTPSALPNAENVAGNYMLMRRMEGNLSEILSYLANPIVDITALDENTISVTAGVFGSATYIQVEPNFFRMVSFEGSAMPQIFSELRFKMEDGSPIQIHVGNGHDLMPLPSGRTIPFLTTYAAIMLISLLFFLITPIIILISLLRNKKKGIKNTHFKLFNIGLLLSGTLLIFNNLICLVRIFTSIIIPSKAELAPHIWINYIIVVLSVFMLVGSIIYLGKEKELITTKNKAFFFATTALIALTIFVLHNWNFFVIL